MSQSNKTKTAKKTFYLLLFFTIFCVAVTTACIYNTLEIKSNNILVQITNSELEPEPISLTKKYFTNGITTETIDYTEGDIIGYTDSEPIYQYNISYDQISGLKNSDVQNKINEEIKNQVLAYKNKLSENPEYNKIYISTYIYGNFSDVLSIDVSYSLHEQDYNGEYGYDYKVGSIGLNYRLDTGEKLKFLDLFMKNTNIKPIIEKSAYEYYAWEHAYSIEEEFDYDFDNTDYGYIENQVFKLVSAYNKDSDVDFYFSTNYIWITIKDALITIDMKDYYEDLAIYTAYVKDNLYTDSSLQKEFYAFVDQYLAKSIEEENVKGDNFYYEIIASNDGTDNAEDVRAKVKEKIYDKIDYYYEIAKQNPDKAYMLSIWYYYYTSESYPAGYSYNGDFVEMDLDYFKEHREEIIANARRNKTSEIWSFDFSETDDNIEFYESFSKYVNDYQADDGEEVIDTRADREAREAEYLEELENETDISETDENG
jgi:hypothetical protein